MAMPMTKVKTGCEVLLEQRGDLLRGRRIGLITNPTGVLSDLSSLVDALYHHPGAALVALFGPEHGIRAGVQDGLEVGSAVDGETGLPIHSLYDHKNLGPSPEMLAGIDLLIFDIQDVGVRFYTYPSTLSYVMEAAARQGIPVLVLDRPNPINGVTVEGNILDPAYSSFVGRYPVAVRHGLTLGELGLFIKKEFGINCDLTVIKMEGWRRELWYDQTGLPWVIPSPNLPTLDTATVYAGTCLVEGVNVSEGRGTARPFEFLGAPWIEGPQLARALNALDLPGVRFRPADFSPTYSKYEGEWCSGVQVHIMDRDLFAPWETGLHIIVTLRELYPEQLDWQKHNWDGELPAFDVLAGQGSVRADIMNGRSVADMMAGFRPALEEFKARRKQYLLYE